MKQLALLVSAISFFVLNVFSQNSVTAKKYIFSYMMEYSGFDHTIKQNIKYRIYWNPGDNQSIAFKISDETGRFVSLEILDRLHNLDIFMDLREHQGFLDNLPDLQIKLQNINLNKTENIDSGKFFISREYIAQKNDKVFHYWIAEKSPVVDSAFAILNSFGLKFIPYPDGQKYIVTKFTEIQGSDTLSWFNLSRYKAEGYFVFDLGKYKIIDRRY